MNKYVGSYNGDGDPLTCVYVRVGIGSHKTIQRALPLRIDLKNHSPTGFAWGYLGSGPAQLALAILAHEYGQQFALANYQSFKEDVVAKLSDASGWALTSTELNAWRKVNEL